MMLVVGLTADEERLVRLSGRTQVANVATAADLERFLTDRSADWEAVLLGHSIDDPMRAIRRVKSVHADILVLLLAQPGDVGRIQHELLLLPFKGEPPRCVPLDERASQVIEAHLTQAKLRRRHSQAIRSANLQVPTRPAAPFRLPPIIERFFDAAPLVLFLLGEDGSILHANRAARELLKPAHPQLLLEAFPVQEREALRDLVERADAKSAIRVTFEGSPLRVFDAVAAQAAPSPDRTGTLLMLNDVTRLAEAERAREREAEFQRRLLSAQAELDLGIVVIEGQRIIYVNEAYERMSGYTEAELREKPMYFNVVPEDREAAAQRHARRMRGEPVPQAYEVTLLCKDGRRMRVEVSARVVEGTRVVAVVRDVTARDALLRELEETRRELSQMDKLASMGSLVGGLAHEVRTPLTIIMNHVNLLEHGVQQALESDDPRPHLARLPDHVAGAVEGVDRIRLLVRDMQRFLTGEAPEKKRIVLDEPVSQAARLFQATQRGRIDIEMDLSSTRLVDADPTQVQQIIVNLLQNATEASPSGGAVTVRTRDVEDGVQLSIEDHGRGIPEEIRSKMFEAFVTTKADSAGLGLTIVRRLCELHHARIEVDSRVGEGTTVRIVFPPAA